MEKLSQEFADRDLIVTLRNFDKDTEVTVIARDPLQNLKEGLYLSDVQEGDLQLTFNEALVEQLTSEGKISQEISTTLLTIFKDHKEVESLSKKLEESANATEKELYKKQFEAAFRRDPSNKLDAMRHLLKIRTTSELDFSSSKIPHEFYKNIDPEKCFGMVKWSRKVMCSPSYGPSP